MSSQSDSRRINVRGAVALGVGSMVGAGIFALMGVAAAKAGSSGRASWHSAPRKFRFFPRGVAGTFWRRSRLDF